MSILPPRTSPSPLVASPTSDDFHGSDLRIKAARQGSLLATDTCWRVEWRVLLRDPASDPPVKKTVLRAYLGQEVIHLELVDPQGKKLIADTLQVRRTERTVDGGCLVQWTVDGERRPLARLMTDENGEAPLLRTSLPEHLGLTGGRHDLSGIIKGDSD